MAHIVEKLLTYLLGAVAGAVIGFVFLTVFNSPEPSDYILVIEGIAGTIGILCAHIIRQRDRLRLLIDDSAAYNEAVTILSHQMRTSLTVANWGTEIMLKNYGDKISDTDREMLQNITVEIRGIVMQSVNLIDIATLESGKLMLSLEPLTLGNVRTIIEETIAKLRPEMEKNGIIFNHSIVLDEAASFETDPLRLRFIIENLIENAVHYIGDGTKNITISVKNDAASLLITVQDSGIGIAPEDRSQIFRRFFRASNAREKVGSGSGIGLYLCKQYVDLHHGTIRFDSKLNEGTTFHVSIPLKNTAHPEEFFEKI